MQQRDIWQTAITLGQLDMHHAQASNPAAATDATFSGTPMSWGQQRQSWPRMRWLPRQVPSVCAVPSRLACPTQTVIAAVYLCKCGYEFPQGRDRPHHGQIAVGQLLRCYLPRRSRPTGTSAFPSRHQRKLFSSSSWPCSTLAVQPKTATCVLLSCHAVQRCCCS